MAESPPSHPRTRRPWRRRQVLAWGAAGMGALALGGLRHHWRRQPGAEVRIPTSDATVDLDLPYDPIALLRDFDYGILRQEATGPVREFEVMADSVTLPLNSAISFVSWNLNSRVPGPTFRAQAGERVRIIFHNQDGHSHSLHFHGTHPAAMDGIDPVRHGQTVVYEFDAEPFGVHPYHCHIEPVTRHISKGLYGLFIVDPPQARPPADEMVLVMAGYDINNDQRNELYAFNGIPNIYRDHPIAIYQHQRVRLYLLNMIEFDPVASFHIHANLFQVYPTGCTLEPSYDTDVITLGTAERHILEFAYAYPGRYMFHPHQDLMAAHGCVGYFDVLEA